MRDFDKQAATFDQRTGLPSSAAEAIARTVARLGNMHAGDTLLEIGAGTGQIGCHFCALPGRYVGFDASAAMLAEFARNARSRGVSATLLQADGNGLWPADAQSIKTFFASRVLHLLRPDHVLAEIFRLALPSGATLVSGRVERSPESLRSRLRREMRARLNRIGLSPSDGREIHACIFDACRLRGAATIEPIIAATWPVTESATRLIQSWRMKKGLAGVDLPDAVKSSILSGLETWSEQEFGSAIESHAAEEKYVLEGVRLPPH